MIHAKPQVILDIPIKRLCLLVWLLMVLPACAVLKPQSPSADFQPPSTDTEMQSLPSDTYFWWYVPVTITWPDEQPAAWYVDVLLAHQVFKPVLLAHAEEIALWRFHRRAVRDNAGHRFRFIFYASSATAAAIFEKIEQNPLLGELIAANVVEQVITRDANRNPSAAVEATSDKSWSPPMQRAWPYYGMGVSQVWLALIDQYVAFSAAGGENVPDSGDIEALQGFYRQIDAKLVATWETEGGHALLHHLNALFGYGEVAIYERRMIRF